MFSRPNLYKNLKYFAVIVATWCLIGTITGYAMNDGVSNLWKKKYKNSDYGGFISRHAHCGVSRPLTTLRKYLQL